MSEENGRVFNMQTPAAILAPKQQYLNLMMNTFYEFGKLCTTTEHPRDIQAKIGMLTQMTINFIPNPKERERLQGLRRDERAEASKKFKSTDEQKDAFFATDCKIIGEIMTLMDDVLAIVERQAIIKTVSSGSELEKSFYPNGYELPSVEEAAEGDVDGA